MSKVLALLKILIPVAILIAAVLLFRVLANSREVPDSAKPAVEPPSVEVVSLASKSESVVVRSQGSIVPSRKTLLSSQVGGKVLFVSSSLEEGASFKKDEVLLRIEPADYEVLLRQAEAAVKTAELLVAKEEKEADTARSEWKKIGLETEPDPLLLRIPQLAQARAQLKAANASVRKAQLDLARTEIKAPYAGRCLAKQTEEGQVVMPGTALATIFATDRSELHLLIPDRDLALLELPRDFRRTTLEHRPKVKLEARFAGKDCKWFGFVDRIGGQIDGATRMVDLIVTIPDPYRADTYEHGFALPLGLFVEASIEGRKLEKVFEVPRTSIRAGRTVWVVDAENRLRSRELRIVVNRKNTVLAEGLEENSRLCISPIEIPIDGMRVRILGAAKR